jgi:beta-1,2-mannobiose phosphorylase / 1,2-beta-oligomannan phosphorylase
MKIKDKLLLKPEDFEPSFPKWKVEGALNPGAIRMPDGKIMLLVRVAETGSHKHGRAMKCPVMVSEKDTQVEYLEVQPTQIVMENESKVMFLKDGICRLPTISHLRRVILSEDGFKVEKIYQKPFFVGKEDDGDFGVEDARLTQIGNKYYMTYVGVSRYEGISTYLAESSDLNKWERKGLIFREQNKDAVLFPEKIDGEYVALNRPESTMHFTKPGIWISYSKDLVYWGRDKNVMRPREKSWESVRIGGGAPPLKTNKGWLIIYHGVKQVGQGSVYSAGAALLDLKHPKKIIARTSKDRPLFGPSNEHEKEGFIDNVVFPTGVVLSKDKKDLIIFSGGADSVITVRKISLKEILGSLKKESS